MLVLFAMVVITLLQEAFALLVLTKLLARQTTLVLPVLELKETNMLVLFAMLVFTLMPLVCVFLAPPKLSVKPFKPIRPKLVLDQTMIYTLVTNVTLVLRTPLDTVLPAPMANTWTQSPKFVPLVTLKSTVLPLITPNLALVPMVINLFALSATLHTMLVQHLLLDSVLLVRHKQIALLTITPLLVPDLMVTKSIAPPATKILVL
jgi:hypothetical protein